MTVQRGMRGIREEIRYRDPSVYYIQTIKNIGSVTYPYDPVRPSVGCRSVGLSVITLIKGGKLHLLAPIRALVRILLLQEICLIYICRHGKW